MRVLIVDDDRAVRDALRRALTLAGYEVAAGRGRPAGADAGRRRPCPTRSCSTSACRASTASRSAARCARAGNRVPILMLTARDAVADRIDGLDAGADDYLVKPFDVGELKARLRALLRRAGRRGRPRRALVRGAAARRRAATASRVDDRFVELTRTEYQLLELLMLNPRRVLPHGLIYDRVWGYDFGPASNALRVYVGYLRRKLEEAGARPLIHTVRGVGYVLREP